VASGRVAYVISIPQSATNAPHQAPDKKYYYRQNFQSVPMEDYQIRDAMRRATTPELFIELAFARGMATPIEYAPHSEISKPITLVAAVSNRSSQPAFHTIIPDEAYGISARLTHFYRRRSTPFSFDPRMPIRQPPSFLLCHNQDKNPRVFCDRAVGHPKDGGNLFLCPPMDPA
jgi:hypothetical protein